MDYELLNIPKNRRGMQTTNKGLNSSAFTIIELLIVIVIIGILVAITAVTYTGLTKQAKEALVKSDLKQATTQLELEKTKSTTGAYPNTIANIKVSTDTVLDITTSNNDTEYCLSASRSPDISFHTTNSNTTPQPGACAGHRITKNLIENGFGEKGDNTGFPNMDYTNTDAPPGANGSFVARTGAYELYCGSQRVSIDKTKKYKLSIWARQTVPTVTTARVYLGLCPYDTDGLRIGPEQYMFSLGTTTTLARPLKKGDTVVYLTNVSSSWYNINDTNYHRRSFIFWNYTDGKGKTWPIETYSRNGWYSDMWDGGANNVNTTNNTITLNKPWPGKDFPTGHPVSNGSAGSTYMYSAVSSGLSPYDWTLFKSETITGIVSNQTSARNEWPLATEAASILVGINLNSPPNTSRQAVGGIDFYEVQ